MSSTKQLMQGWSNTGWSIRDSSCRNCHHYDRVGTYLCPHHRIGHNLECGSCNIRLGTQHLPAIHVRMLRDNPGYRAAYGRAQPAASGLLSGFRRTENRSLQRFVRSGAAQELRAVPVTALSNVAVSPTANRLVSIPMVFIPIHCNGPRHGMDLVMEWTSSWNGPRHGMDLVMEWTSSWNGPRHGMHWYAMHWRPLHTNAFHDVPSGRRPRGKG